MGHEGFHADLDGMQRVIDGDLTRAILHFTKISDAVKTLPAPGALHQTDPANVAGAFVSTLAGAFDTYKQQHASIVDHLNELKNALQHVVDVYRQTEDGNVRHVQAAG